MSTRTCPDWPDLMEIAPELQFKHYTVAEAQLPADALMKIVAGRALRRRDLLRPREERLLRGAHRRAVAEALRQSHWYEVREWIAAGRPGQAVLGTGRQQRLAALEREHVVDDDARHRRARLDRGARRCAASARRSAGAERVRDVRLVHEHVEPCADPARDELVDERVLVDDRAARGVHEGCAVAQEREPLA